MIRLDIISDIACPWCYLGKAMLDRALEAAPDHPFAVEWHPYQLDPGLPAEGMPRDDYMRLKFGDTDAILQAHKPLLELAESQGVAFDLPAIRSTPNTLDAHRLVHWAGIEGRQSPVVGALFRAYWREGRDIGRAEVLAELAEAAGMDGAMVARLLASEADREAIRARIAHARQRGVDSVPTYIIADRHVLFGAQRPATWLQVIDDIERALAETRRGAGTEAGAPDDH